MAKKPTGTNRTPDRPKAPAASPAPAHAPAPAPAQAPKVGPSAAAGAAAGSAPKAAGPKAAAQGPGQAPAGAELPPTKAIPGVPARPEPAQAPVPAPPARAEAPTKASGVTGAEAASAPAPAPAVEPEVQIQTGARVPTEGPTPAARPLDSIPVPAWAEPNPVPPTTPDISPEAASAPSPEPVPEPSREPSREPGREPSPEPGPEPALEPINTPETPQVSLGPSLYVVQITPEMAPIAKVGGLADVVFGLSRELAIRGNSVEIILPKYDNLRYDHIFGLQQVYQDLWVPWYEGTIHCTVWFGLVHDRKCYFIEPHSQDNFFNRGAVYGFNDDVLRFAFFSRAAMEFLWKAGKHPDIIHCHDWQTALVPVLLFEMFQRLGMAHPRVCLTIHNFAHQGLTNAEVLRATGLHQPERFLSVERLRDNRYVNAVNLLKGGIVYSNFVTTVSPRYAFETKDQGQGFGLEPTLHTHHMKYGGVVNGIDYDVWNPEVDHLLPVRYGADNIEGKYANKAALRHRLMLTDNDKPIVAFIGRLDPQKGLELLRHAIFYTLERGGQFVLLGSSPDPRINSDFWGLKRMLNDSPDCHLEIGFDEELSHLIYAGSDIMLVPSRFEPCGLTQLISLRYGTIPVVRSVGGLADTVFDKDHSTKPLHERNGYIFDHYDNAGLESALERAIACYFKYPGHFRDLMRNAMRTDYSWNHPGQDYLNIYHYIRSK